MEKNNKSLYPVFSASLKYITFYSRTFFIADPTQPNLRSHTGLDGQIFFVCLGFAMQVMTLMTLQLPPQKKSEVSSWWLNQPILKNFDRPNGFIFPKDSGWT